jgi:ligand-binding sensor domain-containing protein
VLAKDETDGTLYAGSFSTGLFILKADGSYQTLKTNSILDRSTPNPGWWQVFGLALDHENNLWMTLFGSEHQLYVRVKSSGNWYKFSIPFRTGSYPYAAGNMVVDDYDQIWYICPGPDLGGGAMVYNYNGTPEDPSDDKAVSLHIGSGAGNLPSDRTLCIAKDKNGDIWIGTTDGIGIISCASTIMQTQCDGSIPIVQYDNYAGYLFKGENVRSIAVDGANRKWVGTDNGVWLLSPDANQIVSRFTQDNSPLPSNLIQKIAVDPVTGDVYIGTQQGMVSYHGTATDGGTSNSNVITYPNPVPGNYNGTVAIKGLVANGDVRITDITGQLVYRTTALGGQAVWNGKDYTGHRPEAGVYLIFVTNKDGSQTFAGKMVLTQ